MNTDDWKAYSCGMGKSIQSYLHRHVPPSQQSRGSWYEVIAAYYGCNSLRCYQNPHSFSRHRCFCLSVRRYPELCEHTAFVTGVGNRRWVIPLRSIVEALGPDRTAALPGFHALSGADNKKRKAKAFQETGPEIITALADFNTNEKPTKATEAVLAHFVCQLYVPNTVITQD